MKKITTLIGAIIGFGIIAASPAEAYYHSSYHSSYHSYHTYSRPSSSHSFATHGLAALAGGAIGYMAGSAANHNTTVVHETVVQEEPHVVVVPRPVVVQPVVPQLTNCSETRKAPEIEQDGQEHVVFIKDCLLTQ